MKTVVSSSIISIAVIVSSFLLAGAYKNRYQNLNSVSVTGLGSKNFVSDLIVWSGNFSKKNMVLKNAYSELDADRDNIKKYLISKGIKESQIIFSAVDISKDFDYLYDGNGRQTSSIFTGYRLSQNVQIESNEVNKVEDVSRQITELINTGIEFYSNQPEYYYTKLSTLKIEMIAEASRDALTRAQKIAENGNGELGKLKSASTGVFQIVAQNSSEEFSWGGSFNTSSKRKTASITVKLDYEVN
ncbi:MAG: SIMPL domain-containing protein [Flavobacteriales bacterium]|nr:SIMPL domain-containing protein [Flavobacteriales bacterium]